MIRVFANSSGDWGSIPGRVRPKIFKKWYLMPPCLTLSIIRYESRVSGAIQGKEFYLPLYLGVVANEKAAFTATYLSSHKPSK